MPADAGRFADLRRVAERARDLGPVAYLVNNAVSSETGPFAEVDPEQLWYGMDVSLTGPLVLTRLLMPDLVDQQGAVVMVGSTAFVGWPWVAAYSAAKAGMDAFAYALRRELGPNGVHVAAVHPRGTLTPSVTLDSRAAFESAGLVYKSADDVAAVILDAIRRGRTRVVIGRWEKLHAPRTARGRASPTCNSPASGTASAPRWPGATTGSLRSDQPERRRRVSGRASCPCRDSGRRRR